MGSKTRLSSYCTKRANNGVNLATSRKIITRLARPMSLFALALGHGGIAAQQASGGHAGSDDGTPCYRGNNP